MFFIMANRHHLVSFICSYFLIILYNLSLLFHYEIFLKDYKILRKKTLYSRPYYSLYLDMFILTRIIHNSRQLRSTSMQMYYSYLLRDRTDNYR